VHDADLGIDVGAREHRDHSGYFFRGGAVDAPDHRVGVRAPREGEGERAVEPHVVDVGVAALHELGVFEPLDGAAHVLDRHASISL
jgi:hypothetical protein